MTQQIKFKFIAMNSKDERQLKRFADKQFIIHNLSRWVSLITHSHDDSSIEYIDSDTFPSQKCTHKTTL